MSVDRARYPGIFVFHGDKLTVFESGVQIRYDPKVPEIVTVKTMRVDNGKYHFQPAAWFKLEEGMLVGVGRELPKQAEPGVDHPLALIGDSRIEFRGVGRPEPSGDVLVWRGRYPAPKATVADEWPDDEQITYLVRLGPKVIVVETNKDWPMEVKTGNATVPLAAWR